MTMRRTWSRVVAFLCFAYLLLLLFFHRHLGPSSDPATNDYIDIRGDPLEFHSVVATNDSDDRPRGLKLFQRQLHRLEAGMTVLEQQIAIVKSKLAREALTRAQYQEHLRDKRQDIQQQTVHVLAHQDRSKQHEHHQQQQQAPELPQQRSLDGIPGMAILGEPQHQTQEPLQQQQGMPRQLVNQPSADVRRHDQHIPLNPQITQQFLGPRDGWDKGIVPTPADEYKNSSLIQVAEGVAVYSAYHDDRSMDKPFVRLIVIASAPKGKREVVCHFDPGSGPSAMVSVEAMEYELCENHKKTYLGFIYSCPVPQKLARTPYKLSVASSLSPLNNVTVPLLRVTPRHNEGKVSEESYRFKYNFSICVSPLFGSVLARRLVEFLELTRLLGVQQVFFYDFQLSLTTRRVLQFYQDREWVTVLPWKLPPSMNNKKIWYHGQLITNNDCLYRTMALSAYTAFHDIDEFIVPREPAIRTLGQLIPPVLPNDTCGYSFMSTFYDPNRSSGGRSNDLMTLAHTSRTRVLSKVRTKVLVSPRRVFEVGIHHISKQFQEHWQPRLFDSGKALLHHYRDCIHDYGMRCDSWIQDAILADRYMPQLRDNFLAVVKKLRL